MLPLRLLPRPKSVVLTFTVSQIWRRHSPSNRLRDLMGTSKHPLDGTCYGCSFARHETGPCSEHDALPSSVTTVQLETSPRITSKRYFHAASPPRYQDMPARPSHSTNVPADVHLRIQPQPSAYVDKYVGCASEAAISCLDKRCMLQSFPMRWPSNLQSRPFKQNVLLERCAPGRDSACCAAYWPLPCRLRTL